MLLVWLQLKEETTPLVCNILLNSNSESTMITMAVGPSWAVSSLPGSAMLLSAAWQTLTLNTSCLNLHFHFMAFLEFGHLLLPCSAILMTENKLVPCVTQSWSALHSRVVGIHHPAPYTFPYPFSIPQSFLRDLLEVLGLFPVLLHAQLSWEELLQFSISQRWIKISVGKKKTLTRYLRCFSGSK